MAVHGGPKIATSGLVLSLDAANSSKSTLSTVEVLVVAGGGGGGSFNGGGGGAGGLIYSSSYSITPGSAITVTVGAGGIGDGRPGNGATGASGAVGTNGGNSVFGSLTAIGGGVGASYSVRTSGVSGGSGGGSWGSLNFASGTAGQGNAGGGGYPIGSYYTETAGGGGGAGSSGVDGGTSSNQPGAGGLGLLFNISGSVQFYAAGGGAGANRLGGSALGGSGIGGNGGTTSSLAGVAGVSNTGSGGGGAAYNGFPGSSADGGAGGSGIVIVRYPGPQKAIGGTVTSSGGYTIHTFTTVGSTTFTPLSTSNGSAISGLTDISNNGNFGTAVNGPTYSSANGGSIAFDGVDDYINLPYTLLSGTGNFTVSIWLKCSSVSNVIGTLFGNYPAGNLEIFYGSRYIGMWLNNTSTYLGTSPWNTTLPEFTTNYTQIVALRKNTSDTEFYIDGVLVKTGSSSDTIGSVNNFRMGTNTSGSEIYTGNIYNVSIYNRALSATEILQNFNATKSRYYKPVVGLSSDNPATTASEIKNADPYVSNGAYWYRFSDGTIRSLWTDFTTYAPYSFVMVNRIWSGSQNQYLTTEENVTDLRIVPSNSAPTRHSKLSDAYMNEIISPNTIRWAIVGNGSIFYRLDDSPQWYSNHGISQSCSYDRGFYSGYATPSSSPSWQTSFGVYQACGGAYDVSNAWLPLTGIHINDGTYFGGYSGSSSARLTPPSPYSVGGTSNDAWSQNGYVLLSW